MHLTGLHDLQECIMKNHEIPVYSFKKEVMANASDGDGFVFRLSGEA
jgi:hypothetical protein